MRRAGLIALLALLGCARSPVYVTAHGLEVFDDGGAVPTRIELEAETARVLALYAERVPPELWRAAALDGVALRVVDAPFRVGGDLLGGVYSPAIGIQIWLDGRPLDDTPLAHEIGHVLVQCCARSGAVSKEYGVP